MEKINSYSCWTDCCFEKFENILKGELIDSSKSFNDIKDNVIILFEVQKNMESKNPKALKEKKRKNNVFRKLCGLQQH